MNAILAVRFELVPRNTRLTGVQMHNPTNGRGEKIGVMEMQNLAKLTVRITATEYYLYALATTKSR
jgi:hypothetical protein